MRLKKEDIVYTAALAKLSITQAEAGKLQLELAKIIAESHKLNELDTSNVEPMEHIAGSCNVFRKDLVIESFDTGKLMECAPSHENGYYNVPIVME